MSGCGFQPDLAAIHAKVVEECALNFGQPDCVLALDDEARAELGQLAFELGAEHAIPDEQTQQCVLDQPCDALHRCLDPEDRMTEDLIYAACIGFCYSRLRPCAETDCSTSAVEACVLEFLDCQDACDEDPYYTPEP